MKDQINIRARIGRPLAPAIPTSRQPTPTPGPAHPRPGLGKPKPKGREREGGSQGRGRSSSSCLPACLAFSHGIDQQRAHWPSLGNGPLLFCGAASASAATATTAAGEQQQPGSADTHTLCCSPLTFHFLCLFCRSTSTSNNHQFVHHHHNGPILSPHQDVSCTGSCLGGEEEGAKFWCEIRKILGST